MNDMQVWVKENESMKKMPTPIAFPCSSNQGSQIV